MKRAAPAWAALGALRDVQGTASARPIAVGGARELVPVLAKELRAAGDEGAVMVGATGGAAAALVWIGAPDGPALSAAFKRGIPIVGVTEGESLPYVLDTDLVTVAPGRPFPVDEIARALARVLGEEGAGLAARLPVLREAVVDELVEVCARRNGLIGAAVWIPGVDLPVLMLNQLRLVFRVALASGRELDTSLWPEALAVVAAGFALRRAARGLVDAVGTGEWALKGGIAYAGTRAIGEAARRRFG